MHSMIHWRSAFFLDKSRQPEWEKRKSLHPKTPRAQPRLELCSLVAGLLSITGRERVYWQLSLTIFKLLTFMSTTVLAPASVFSVASFFCSCAGGSVTSMPVTVTVCPT